MFSSFSHCLFLCLLEQQQLLLQVKFRDYAKNTAKTKSGMATDASSAFFSLTQAEYAAGNFKQKVAEGSMVARIRIGAGVDNVAGVKLPVFTKYETGATADNQSLGLVGGGKKIVAVREKFTNLLEMLIKYVQKHSWLLLLLLLLLLYYLQNLPFPTTPHSLCYSLSLSVSLSLSLYPTHPSDWHLCKHPLSPWMKH